ncbi:MAG: sulfatase-like hydrolase/transferase [Bacteroidales bacterium]|nr:sulfatase-like hydrolase/transferase [Bacteroidales bacterium]
MKQRFIYLLSLFLTFVGYFLLQKPLFMLANDALGKGVSLADALRVMGNGLSLDATTAGYLTVIPWLALLASCWFRQFPLRKLLTGYYAVASLILALVFVADLSLYPFWGFKLDASVFFYLDSPKNAMASVSMGYLLLRAALMLLLAVLCTGALFRLTPVRLPALKRRITGSVGLLLTGGALFVIIRGGVTESTANIGQVYFCNNEFLNHSAVNPAFSLLASAGKTKDYASQFDFFPEEERAQLFEGLYPTRGKNRIELLNNRRPNLLIVLLEGFGGTMVESLGGVKDASPNIDRLSKEGVWFTRCYANSYRTDRGTVCALSGYQSFPNLSVMKIPAKSRTLPTIAQQLVKEGYHTDFLYGGDINFTNMKSYLLQGGYQRLTADTDFSLQERQNPWGVNDDITFDHLYQVIKERTEGPWHTTFLTLSSHEPFEVPYHRLDAKKPNAFAYTDDCLGRFVDRLKQLPQWKDLLIVCLPDHGIFYPEQGTAHDWDIHHIPMLWLGGAIREPRVIDCLMNQTDLAATLLGQLDLPHEDFTFSRNVLGEEYTYPFAYYTFNNGFAFADSTGFTLFDNAAGRVLEDLPSANEQRVRLGKAILQSSYDDLGKR